ncbi:ABC transporter substrate-binding protein [Streptomyces sp. NPDC051985]|uniref:ABC transporter substrate-binding protein n=1 Tax=Streptomyces sp. NPDC051985 TaxID=3155807 RepID=UPI00341582FD
MADSVGMRNGIGLGIAGLLLLTTACSTGTASSASGTGTILLDSNFDTLDPALTKSSTSILVQGFLYDPLIHFDDRTGTITSGLAQSWKFTSTTAEFVLRDHVTCSDGSAFTVKTAARNLERAKDPKVNAPFTASRMGTLGYQVSTDPATRTLRVKLDRPNSFLARGLAQMTMVCDSGLDSTGSLAAKADGTGPYTLKNYVPNQEFTLQLRKGYGWGSGGGTTAQAGLPTTLRLRLTADENTAANLVLSHDAQAARFSAQTAKRFDGQDVTKVPDVSLTYLLNFNERAGHPTADPAVRRALAQVVDSTAFTKVESQGTGTVPESLRAKGSLCLDPARTSPLIPSFDAKAAAAALEGDGWARNAKGVWEKAGKTLSVRYLKGETSDAGAEFLRKAWSDFGIAVKVDTTPVSQSPAVLFAGTAWDVAIVTSGSPTPKNLDVLVNGPASPQGSNYPAIANKDYIAAAKAAMALPGNSSCPEWIKGEQALLKAVDVVPVAETSPVWIQSGIKFKLAGATINPLSLRVG